MDVERKRNLYYFLEYESNGEWYRAGTNSTQFGPDTSQDYAEVIAGRLARLNHRPYRVVEVLTETTTTTFDPVTE